MTVMGMQSVLTLKLATIVHASVDTQGMDHTVKVSVWCYIKKL